MAETIVLTPAVSTLEARAYLSTRKEFIASKNPIQTGIPCFFPLFNCCLPIIQFIDLTDPTDEFKNDFYTFIFQVSTGNSVEATITNESTGVTNTLSDLYGIHNDVGSITLRPLVWNFKTDWNDIHALMGFGEYKFDFTIKNALGNVIWTGDSPCFRLMQYDCDDAHGTVRIETNQTGYVVNGFDYRNLSTAFKSGSFFVPRTGWKQQIRWYGKLVIETPDEESDYIQNSSRIEKQIQEKITEKFKFTLDFLRSEIGQNIIKDQFLADQILISDYNYNNYEVYRNKDVRKISTDEIVWNKLQRAISISWTMKDVDEGTVKRIHG